MPHKLVVVRNWGHLFFFCIVIFSGTRLLGKEPALEQSTYRIQFALMPSKSAKTSAGKLHIINLEFTFPSPTLEPQLINMSHSFRGMVSVPVIWTLPLEEVTEVRISSNRTESIYDTRKYAPGHGILNLRKWIQSEFIKMAGLNLIGTPPKGNFNARAAKKYQQIKPITDLLSWGTIGVGAFISAILSDGLSSLIFGVASLGMTNLIDDYPRLLFFSHGVDQTVSEQNYVFNLARLFSQRKDRSENFEKLTLAYEALLHDDPRGLSEHAFKLDPIGSLFRSIQLGYVPLSNRNVMKLPALQDGPDHTNDVQDRFTVMTENMVYQIPLIGADSISDRCETFTQL